MTAVTVARFTDRYDARAQLRAAGAVRSWVRPVRIVIGSLLLAVLIGWLPGPGFVPLALVGGSLLAGEVAWAARLLDRGEARGRAWMAARAARRSEPTASNKRT